MTISFRFKEDTIRDMTIQRPRIPVTLSHNGMNFEVAAILDSGSDFSIVPKEVAEALGLDLGGKSKKINGIGGGVEVAEDFVNIMIEGKPEKHRFRIPVQIFTQDAGWNDVLIGREPFFREFDITFRLNSNRIVLKRTRRR